MIISLHEPLSNLPFSKVLLTQRASKLSHHLLHPRPQQFPSCCLLLVAHRFPVTQALDSSLFSFWAHESNQLLSSDSFHHLHLPLVSLHSTISPTYCWQRHLPESLPRWKSFGGSLCPKQKISTLGCHHHLWATMHATFYTECPLFLISLLKPHSTFWGSSQTSFLYEPATHHFSMKSSLVSMDKSETSFL